MRPAIRNELLVTRVFDAPIERVWKAWSDPREVRKWWGPKGFTAPHVTSDFRMGGKFLYCMHGTGLDGVERDYWSTGKFLDILPMQKIMMSLIFADKHGQPVPASHYGMPGKWADETRLTATFEFAKDGKTRLTIRQTGIPNEMLEVSSIGWNQSLDKFAEVLADLTAQARAGAEARKHRLAA